MGRGRAESFFGSKKEFYEDGWKVLNAEEKNKILNQACTAFLSRDIKKWPEIASFYRMDSASDYSFEIPKSTFKVALNRLLEERNQAAKERAGDSQRSVVKLIGFTPGAKGVDKAAISTTKALMKGIKMVSRCLVEVGKYH